MFSLPHPRPLSILVHCPTLLIVGLAGRISVPPLRPDSPVGADLRSARYWQSFRLPLHCRRMNHFVERGEVNKPIQPSLATVKSQVDGVGSAEQTRLFAERR